MKSFVLRLTFVMRFMATQKWPIGFVKKYNYILQSPTLGKSGYLFSRAGARSCDLDRGRPKAYGALAKHRPQ